MLILCRLVSAYATFVVMSNVTKSESMNLKLQKKLCWFGCVVLSAGQSYGQLPQINNDFSVTPVSPEAAALVKMTEYPVNHNTGIPDITLPLFTAVSGELSLPINMSYHSGGFKVQEIAGYAGLGWALTCDLQITRVINGLDDFGAGGYLRNTKMKGVVDGSLVQSGTWYPNDDQAVYELATTLDGAPDKFHFRLMNKTGSFYLQKNEQGGFSGFVCDPHEKVKIEVRTEGSTPYFFITDTDGTLYKFGTGGSVDMGNITINDSRKDVGVETSGPSPHQHAVTTWKCIQVSNFNNTATISFEYVNKRERFVPDLNSSIEYWERTDIYGWQNPNMSQVNNGKDGTMTNLQSWLSAIGEKLENLTPRYVLHCPNGYSYTHLPYLSINNSDTTVLTRVFRSDIRSVTGRYYTNLAISKIIFDQGEVRFTYDLDAGNFPTILSEIKIVDPEFSELKTIKFLQSYTIDSRMKDAPGQSDFLGVNYLDEIHVQNATKSFEKYFFTITIKNVSDPISSEVTLGGIRTVLHILSIIARNGIKYSVFQKLQRTFFRLISNSADHHFCPIRSTTIHRSRNWNIPLLKAPPVVF